MLPDWLEEGHCICSLWPRNRLPQKVVQKGMLHDLTALW